MKLPILIFLFSFLSSPFLAQMNMENSFYSRGTVSIVQVDIFCEAIITGQIYLTGTDFVFIPTSSNKKVVRIIDLPFSKIKSVENKLCNTFRIKLYDSTEYKFAVRNNKRKILNCLNELIDTINQQVPSNTVDTLNSNTVYEGNIALCSILYGTPLIIKPIRIIGSFTLSDSLLSFYPTRMPIIKEIYIQKKEIKSIKSTFLKKGIIIKLNNNYKYKFATDKFRELILMKLSPNPII